MTRLLLVGPRHAGRRTALQQQLAPYDRRILEVDLERVLAEGGDIDERLRILERNARLEGAVLLLRGDGVFGGKLDARIEWSLGQWLDRCAVPLAVTAAESVPLLYQGEAPVLELAWTRLDLEQRHCCWGQALRRAGLPGEGAQRLASAFDIEAGLTYRVAEQAVIGFEPDRPESLVTAISAVLDRRTGHALADIADRVETTLDWSDVVLPPEVLDVLQEVLTQARLRTRVLDEWGFRRTLAYGRGLSCLFSGPPGTGKTMVAAIMARSVGRAMFRVDLSRVVSKWVGETEKNLARVFDEADRAGAILLFDEADSLFAKRTEVKAANDRFANMEVNYLLQRMERFNGMSVLTTNFERSFDEAFKRRLKFRVYFPKPDASMRSEMWRRMIPSGVPRSPDLHFDDLGRSFKLSGGSIKNAVLRAAYYAAEAGEALCQSHLVRAAKTEQREMGHL